MNNIYAKFRYIAQATLQVSTRKKLNGFSQKQFQYRNVLLKLICGKCQLFWEIISCHVACFTAGFAAGSGDVEL